MWDLLNWPLWKLGITLQHLNFNLLRSLSVLLEERHVTRAANKLCLTQSAMSRQLGQLRQYFEDPLLLREGSGYLLTPKAQTLIPKVQHILVAIEELNDTPAFNPAVCDREFRFASTDYVAQFIFPELLLHLQTHAPNIRVHFDVLNGSWLPQLGELPLDMVSTMAATLPDNLDSYFLGQDSPVCLMSQTHPLSNQTSLELEDLAQHPFVRINSGGDKDSFLDDALSAAGLKREIRFEVPFFNAGFAAVTQNQLLMVVPAHIARNTAAWLPVTSRPFTVTAPSHRYYLCWHRQHQNDPAHHWMRESLAEILQRSMYSPKDHDLIF